MKKIIFISALVTMYASICFSQKVIWQGATEHDFGLIEPDRPASIDFKYKNISKEPLTVDNVRTTCGCTTPEWTFAEVILPDSVGFIKLVYDAKKTGPFYKTAKVFFNGQKKGDKLKIEGEVMEK